MRIEIHHIHHYPEIEAMSDALENIRREVGEAKAGQASAVALISGIREQLAQLVANATDLEALKTEVNQLATDLSDSTDALGAAMATDGGGAEPAPVEPPVA